MESEEAPSYHYSSSKTVRLVNEPKSIAYIEQLVLLVGKKCRVTGCEEEVVVSVHTNTSVWHNIT